MKKFNNHLVQVNNVTVYHCTLKKGCENGMSVVRHAPMVISLMCFIAMVKMDFFFFFRLSRYNHKDSILFSAVEVGGRISFFIEIQFMQVLMQILMQSNLQYVDHLQNEFSS